MSAELNEIPEKKVLEKSSIESVAELYELQGQELNEDEAKKLRQLQEEFCLSALKNGIETLEEVERGNIPQGNFASYVKNISMLFKALRDSKKSKTILQKVKSVQKKYEEVHNDGSFNDRQLLFLEFLLGLAFAELNIHIAVLTSKKIVEDEEKNLDEVIKNQIRNLSISSSSQKIIEGMEGASETAYQLGNLLQLAFEDSPEEYWRLSARALKSDTELEKAASTLLSMRHIPQNTALMGWLNFYTGLGLEETHRS